MMARAILFAVIEEEQLIQRARLERRQLREESRPFEMPDTQFRQYYRLSKVQFYRLCEIVVPLLPVEKRVTAIKPQMKVLAAVAFFAHGSYQKQVGAMYHLGLCQTSICGCLQEVTKALNSPLILQTFIKFPFSLEERENIAQGFMNKFGFPGVLGCIDGTHVALIRPSQREEDYFNRKGYHSLNVMIICDSNLIIRHVDASFGGAAHDSHVWNNSVVKRFMENRHLEGESFWLLGDSAYAQRPWMMQPILHAAPNSAEELYTNLHCRTRNVVERCFGVLKTRWRCLLAHRVLHYGPIKAGTIVNACVVLHNFINDGTVTIDQEEVQLDRSRQPSREPERGHDENADNGRSAVVNRLWLSRTSRQRLQTAAN